MTTHIELASLEQAEPVVIDVRILPVDPRLPPEAAMSMPVQSLRHVSESRQGRLRNLFQPFGHAR